MYVSRYLQYNSNCMRRICRSFSTAPYHGLSTCKTLLDRDGVPSHEGALINCIGQIDEPGTRLIERTLLVLYLYSTCMYSTR